MVDWDLAVATGTQAGPPRPARSPPPRPARPSPSCGTSRPRRTVTSPASPGWTRRPSGADAVVVVDRPGWIQANAAGFRTVLEPLVDEDPARSGRRPPVADAVGSRVTGVQTGSLLAFLATKVLGQYELFPPYGVTRPTRPGRLLLVAPNIVPAEREMGVDPRDFRLWVCLHEETHRVQFGAVPWLRGHMMDEIAAFVGATDVDPAAVAERLKAGGRPPRTARSGTASTRTPSRGRLARRGRADPCAARDPRPDHDRRGVFVDFGQNARDRTIASAYSVRPTPDARVSAPLDW